MAKIDVAEDLIPVGEFKTHASRLLRRLHETGRPLVITQNGKASAVVLTPEEFEQLGYRQQVRQKVKAGIRSAEAKTLQHSKSQGVSRSASMAKPLKVEFSLTALLDLEDIADDIAEDTPAAAEEWVGKLIEAAEKVASHPRSGRAVPEVDDPKIREIIVGKYRVIYRLDPKRLLVLTVIEGHRRLRELSDE